MNAPIDTSRRPAPEVLAAVLGELATRFGERAVVNASVREQHGHGEGLADARCRRRRVPAHERGVAAIVKICASVRVPVIAFGVGTSLEGHVAAIHGGVWRRPLADEQGAGDQRRGPRLPRAGRRVARAAERGAQGHRRLLPDRPGANASWRMPRRGAVGTNAVRYGTMRENVLGLTVVTADGRIVRTRPGRASRRRLRPHAALRRQRGHAGDHHRGGTAPVRRLPEAISAAVAQFRTCVRP